MRLRRVWTAEDSGQVPDKSITGSALVDLCNTLPLRRSGGDAVTPKSCAPCAEDDGSPPAGSKLNAEGVGYGVSNSITLKAS